MFYTNQILEAHKLHHENRRDDLRQYYDTRTWWKECGAFIGIYPRQSGKTVALARLASRWEFSRLLVCNKIQKEYLVGQGYIPSMITVVRGDFQIKDLRLQDDPSLYHIFIDEFMWMEKEAIDIILDQKWNSVTMLGSMR